MGAAVQALSGALFWLLAARRELSADVGAATALLTSVLFVSFATGLGLQVALARYAAERDRDSHVIFSWALVVNGLMAGAGALTYLGVVHGLIGTSATDSLFGWSSIGGAALFVFTVVGSSWSLIVDVRWMTQRRWTLVLLRIAITGFIRIPLIFLAVGDSTETTVVWLFVLASVPTAVSGFVGALTMRRITGAGLRWSPTPETTRPMLRYAAVNYLSTLAYQAPSFVLPVIVLIHVSDTANASFYVAWGITAIAFYVPLAIGQALLAEGGRHGASLTGQVRLALVVAVTLMSGAALLTAAFSGIVVTVYGPEYKTAADILPTLIIAAVPWAVTSVYLTEARVRHATGATIAITLTLTLSIIGPALFLVPRDGVTGAATAYLGGNVIAAVVAIVSRRGAARASAPSPA